MPSPDPNPTVGSPIDTDPVDFVERVRLLYSSTPQAVAAIAIATGIVWYLNADQLPGYMLNAWIIGMIYAGGVRLSIYYKFRSDEQAARFKLWLKLYILVSFLIGVTWSYAVITFLPRIDGEMQLLFVIVLIAYLSGTMTTQYPFASSFLAIFAPPSISLFYVAFVGGDELLRSIGVLFLVYAAFVVSAVNRMRRSLLSSLQLRMDNEAMATSLMQEKQDMEKLNESLNREISMRRESESNLISARDEAVKANSVKSEFMGTISHEMRTPMNGIIGVTSLLKDTDLDAEQSEYLNAIEHSSDDMMHIINNMLEYTELISHPHEPARDDLIPADVADNAISSLSTRANDKGLHLQAEYQASAGTVCRGDSRMTLRVLKTLVGNAIKFSNDGSIIVRAQVTPIDTDSCRVRFEVEDHGIGIAQEDLPLLFQEFSQADSSKTRRHGGAGLGLAIARLQVDLMQGDIGVASVQGQGSTFWLEIPMQRVAQS